MSNILLTVLTDETVRDETAIATVLGRDASAGAPWFNEE